MAKLGYISKRARREAQARAARRAAAATSTRKIREPFFFDYVKQQLIDRFGVNTVRKGGLKVYTTIDPKLQKAGREAIDSTLNYPADPSAGGRRDRPAQRLHPGDGVELQLQAQPVQPRRAGAPPAGLRVQDVRAHDGDQARHQPEHDRLRVAAARPQDARTTAPGRSRPTTRPTAATMNLVRATLRSDNTVYAQLDLDLGPKSVADTAKEMGITTKLDGYPAEGLGGLKRGVSPLEMANAYATLASGGIRNKPIAITQGDVPRRQGRGPRQAEARARASRTRSPTRSPRS